MKPDFLTFSKIKRYVYCINKPDGSLYVDHGYGTGLDLTDVPDKSIIYIAIQTGEGPYEVDFDILRNATKII